MLFEHYADVPSELWRWPNFSPDEPNLACPCCGEFYLDFVSMDMLQLARNRLGQPLRINSGHRCGIHNARVGGVPLSQHKKIAFDVAVGNHEREDLFFALGAGGFTTFGFYQTFIHVDKRPGRVWFGEGGKALWPMVSFQKS